MTVFPTPTYCHTYLVTEGHVTTIYCRSKFYQVNEAIIDWDTENEKIWKCYYFKHEQMDEHKLTKQNLHC